MPLEKNSTDSYGEYLDLLASRGEPYGRTRAKNLSRKAPADLSIRRSRLNDR